MSIMQAPPSSKNDSVATSNSSKMFYTSETTSINYYIEQNDYKFDQKEREHR